MTDPVPCAVVLRTGMR